MQVVVGVLRTVSSECGSGVSEVRNLIVFGGGRMGLSHAAMAGLLDAEISVVVVEPHFATRCFLRLVKGRGFQIKKKCSLTDLRKATHAIVATPPRVHQDNLKALIGAGFVGRILVEKPVEVSPDILSKHSNIMSGYVLRHSYMWRLLTSSLAGSHIEKLAISLETNQDFSSMTGSWRSREHMKGLSLLSEFGSHCINLALDLSPTLELDVTKQEQNLVKLQGYDGSTRVEIELLADSRNVRKSVYRVCVDTDKKRFETDFYSFSSQTKLTKLTKSAESTSLAALGVREKAYLRGQEFSAQMKKFLSDELISVRDINQAIATDEILTNLSERFE